MLNFSMTAGIQTHRGLVRHRVSRTVYSASQACGACIRDGCDVGGLGSVTSVPGSRAGPAVNSISPLNGLGYGPFPLVVAELLDQLGHYSIAYFSYWFHFICTLPSSRSHKNNHKQGAICGDGKLFREERSSEFGCT